MDSVSQMALGAAVAEASLGRKVGRRAVVIGAALGTLPDLDVLIHYADAIDSFTLHRSFSHSLFVLSLLSLPLSQLCRRLFDRDGLASPGLWLFGVWAVLITHPLLDGFTVYGTQLFWPLPVPPVAVSSIFIIDPMYTLPLLLGLLLALCWRDQRGRRANATGLILAQAWLLVMLLLQQTVRTEALAALKQQNINASSIRVLPLPLGMMWRTLAIEDDDILEGWISLIDGSDDIRFDRIPRNLKALGELKIHPPVQRLSWFTRDYMTLRESDGVLVLTDLRMGSATNPVFAFEIAERQGDSFSPILTRDRLTYVCPPELALLAGHLKDPAGLPSAQLPGDQGGRNAELTQWPRCQPQ